MHFSLFRSFVLSCFRDFNLKFAVCILQFLILLFFLLSSLVLAGDIPMGQVVALPVASDPTVCFRLWFKVGSQNDPPGKEGLAALTAAMLTDASTKSHTYEEILDRLFPLAGSYSAITSVEETVIFGRIHKDNLDQYYQLLMQAIMEPAFRQDDLDRLKSEALNYLENTLRYSSDEELGKAVLYNTIFRGTPYGHLPAGTIEGVESITLEDVKNFYHEHYTRDNVLIGIGGGYDERLLEKIRTDLAALPAGKPRTGAPAVAAENRGPASKDRGERLFRYGHEHGLSDKCTARRKRLVCPGCGQFLAGRASQSQQPSL